MLTRCFLLFAGVIAAEPTQIDFWYGDHQQFGNAGGHPQRWVNILGEISSPAMVAKLSWTLNERDPAPLSFREDRKRMAKEGDFNAEMDRNLLKKKGTPSS